MCLAWSRCAAIAGRIHGSVEYTVAFARPTPEGDVLLSLREVGSRTDAERLGLERPFDEAAFRRALRLQPGVARRRHLRAGGEARHA